VRVVEDLAQCPRPAAGYVVTIGAFDGVHLGHLRLIELVCDRASQLAVPSALVTFDRHPAQIVRPDSAPLLLTDLPTKLDLLAATRLDYTVVVTFDAERASETAQDFVREVLVGCLGARLVVIGHDFHFGKRRGGNVALLRSMGQDLGFEVEGVDLFPERAETPGPVSSTRVRTAIAEGNMDQAARLLGRWHRIPGRVSVESAAEGAGAEGAGAEGAGRLVLDVSPELLVPPPGSYAGAVIGGLTAGGRQRRARARILIVGCQTMEVHQTGARRDRSRRPATGTRITVELERRLD